ncbi:MAG: hypothetical protein WBK55_04885 [Alphaproteobacteria bacterium]
MEQASSKFKTIGGNEIIVVTSAGITTYEVQPKSFLELLENCSFKDKFNYIVKDILPISRETTIDLHFCNVWCNGACIVQTGYSTLSYYPYGDVELFAKEVERVRDRAPA